MLACSGGAWAAGTSGTLSFTAGDGDVQYSLQSTTRTVGGQTFTISALPGNVLGYDSSQGADGLYVYDGGASSGVNVTIAAPNGYVFDIDSFKALASDTVVSYVLTYGNGSTASGSLNGVSTSGLSTLSPTISGIKQIVLSSVDYAVFQDFALSNIHPLTFAVTYNGNGNTGGAVPTDATAYSNGSTVTVLGNTGSLTRTGYTFYRWDTVSGGGGAHYVGGDTFSISSDTTLYAQWTANPPSATTGSATSVTATGATLGGTVNDNGLATTVTFDYGLTTGYGTNVAATTGGTVGAGTGSTSVGLSLSGLTCNTPYHFRAKAVNAGGTTYGSDGNFTTTACVPGAPTIGTATAGNGQASVVFSAPGSDGGAAISGYTVTSNPGSKVGTGTTSPITVTGLTNGTAYTFTVTATNSVGTGAASASSSSVTPKATQAITFANPGAQNFGTTPTLSATADSGLTVTFTSSTTGVCTITSGGTLTFLTTGTCTINADQAGNATYAAATTVTQPFAINAVAPGAPTGVTTTVSDGQATVTFSAPASNGGAAITGYTVVSTPAGGTDTNAGSTALSHVVTGLANGTAYTFTVTATNGAGTGSASAATTSATPRGNQAITFNNPGAQNFGSALTLSATTNAAGQTVAFSSSTTGVCTVSGTTATFVMAGTCTIKADAAATSSYLAAPTVTQSFSVNAVVPGAPTITSVTGGIGQAMVVFTAPASNGGAAITGYTVTSSPDNLTATALGSPITLNGVTNGTAYTFTVTATNSAGTGPASAPSTSFTPKGIQTITFAQPAAQSFGTTPTLAATASSGLTVTFTSSTTGVCTITGGGALTFLTTGTCTINAAQAGNAAYVAAATVTWSFNVAAVVPGAPTIGSASAGDTLASVTFTAPAFTGGSAVTSYTVTTNPGGLTATGTASPITVTGLTNGTAYTFTVTATNNVGTGAASAASSSVTPNPGPAVASVAVPANGTYKIGDNLDFTIIWDSVATVTGTPRMALVIGSSTVYATYMSGSGTTATLFRYTVTAGQSDSDGITVGALTLNGGTIRNSANSNATLTLTGVGNTSGVLVDTTAPTLPAVNIVVNNQSDPHKIVLTFNKALNATTIGAASAWAAAANGGAPIYAIAGAALTAANQVTLTLAAVDITTAATFITDSAANAHLRITPPATLADSVGNTYAAGQVTESGAAHILDTTPPVLASVGIGAATSTGGTMTAIASEKAKGYWIAVAGGATAPAVAQVKAGVAYGGVTVVADGTGALPAGSAGSIALNGLAPSTVYDIYLVAEDAAGNATAAVAKAVITTGAALKVSTLPDGAVTTDTTLNVSGTAGTPANLKSLTINGTSVAVAADGSFSYPVQLLAGANAITVVATDISGTIATDSRTITLDSSALHLAVAYPPDNKALIQQSVTVTGSIAELLASGTAKIAAKAEAATAADPTMVVSYSINDGTPGTATLTDGTYSFTVDLTSGMNTIQISAANGAGKTAQAKRTVTYQPAFSLTVSDPASDIRTPQTSYLLQGIVADNSAPVTVTITMDGQTYTPTVDSTTGAFQQQLTFSGSKVYQVSVTATDGSATLSVPRNIITVAGAGSAFTIVDALTALKASVGLVTPDQSQILRLDVAPMVSGVSVGDGMVDMEDVIIVLRKAVGLL
nr:fibronectin type III domain-containing protein [Geobacter sp. FeAm09]